MEYKVDGWNNFCRVFELPEKFPSDYCFGRGRPVNFQIVDWFNPVPGVGQHGVTKEEWRERVGEIEVEAITIDELYESIVPFLLEKTYIKPKREYLVLCDFGAAISFNSKEFS